MFGFQQTSPTGNRGGCSISSDSHNAGATIRVVLPFHLRTLAGVDDEVRVAVRGRPSVASALDALEERFPMLRGTIRDHVTRRRRPFIRFFACRRDFSNEAPESELPEDVARGAEPLLVVGAIAGG